MKKIRFLAMLLLLVQLLVLCAACDGGDPVASTPTPEGTTASTGDSQGSTTTGGGASDPDGEEDSYLYLAVDGEAQYDIVGVFDASDKTKEYVHCFVEEFKRRTGATLRRINDTTPPTTEREILIGAFRNREEAKVQSVTSYTGYRLGVVGERIVLSTCTDEYVKRMLNIILENLVEVEEGCWGVDPLLLDVERDFYTDRTVPLYDTKNGTVAGNSIYRNAYDGYTVGIERTNAEEFAAYLAKLEALGYTAYDENHIGLVDFYTYVKEDASLFLQYNTSDALKGASAKITLTYGETLPATEAKAFTKTADAMVVNPVIDGVGVYGNGMHLLFQLGDGSFVIADGALYLQSDLQRLINLIKDSTPAGQTPTISLWLWTHAHGDHVDLPRKAMKDFKNAGIEILAFGHNFPDWNVISETEGIEGASYYSSELVETAKQYYPKAVEWVMHAGQRMYIADAVIECIWSHEDVHPLRFSSLNDTCTVFSVTIDGIKTMVLGDCQSPNSKMISYYREAMRSHLVQNSHHTLNGPKAMYEYIDPIISFWARDKAHGINGECARTEHGQYLLNTRWTRTDENGQSVYGDRQHYSLEEHVVFYIKDLKAAYGHLK